MPRPRWKFSTLRTGYCICFLIVYKGTEILYCTIQQPWNKLDFTTEPRAANVATALEEVRGGETLGVPYCHWTVAATEGSLEITRPTIYPPVPIHPPSTLLSVFLQTTSPGKLWVERAGHHPVCLQ